jgi:hypothetical protein
MTWVIAVAVARLPSPLHATGFENGYATREELVCSAMAKKEFATAVQRAFRTQFHTNNTDEYPFTPVARNSSRNGASGKMTALTGPPCLMQLWTVFGLASKAAHVQAMKPEDLAVRYEFCCHIPARTENRDLPARFNFSDQATFHINE